MVRTCITTDTDGSSGCLIVHDIRREIYKTYYGKRKNSTATVNCSLARRRLKISSICIDEVRTRVQSGLYGIENEGYGEVY